MWEGLASCSHYVGRKETKNKLFSVGLGIPIKKGPNLRTVAEEHLIIWKECAILPGSCKSLLSTEEEGKGLGNVLCCCNSPSKVSGKAIGVDNHLLQEIPRHMNCGP